MQGIEDLPPEMLTAYDVVHRDVMAYEDVPVKSIIWSMTVIQLWPSVLHLTSYEVRFMKLTSQITLYLPQTPYYM